MILTNYCAFTYKTYPKKQQYNQLNILCNSKNTPSEEKERLKKEECIFDEDDINISYLNYTFAELTALYWVWKNSSEQVVGLTHYRRFWDENVLNEQTFKKNQLYVPQKIAFQYDKTIMDQFVHHHGNYIIRITESILKKNNFTYKINHFNTLYKTESSHFFNMFFCEKQTFNKICQILFEVLFSVYSENFLFINNLPENQRKVIGFLSERILGTIFLNKDYFLSDIDLIECPVNII